MEAEVRMMINLKKKKKYLLKSPERCCTYMKCRYARQRNRSPGLKCSNAAGYAQQLNRCVRAGVDFCQAPERCCAPLRHHNTA